MKVAIMQPYFFPYLGYWQMFNAVDKFVLLDDVNFIKRGYINSNSVLVNGSAHRFSIPLDRPSQNKLINETKLSFSSEEKEKFLKMIYMAYKKAPYFYSVYELIEQVVYNNTNDLTQFIKYSFEVIKKYLDLDTEILLSSEIEKNNSLKAEQRIIEINKCLGADMYINAIGGQALYDFEHFAKENIALRFIKMDQIEYKQYKDSFVPNLSFIDVMMFNDINSIKKLLLEYELLSC